MDMNTSSPALSIAAVSRRWREIALSTPQLWSNIAIGIDRASPIQWLQHQQQTELDPCTWNTRWDLKRARTVWKGFAKICIARAGTQPLTLTFGEWMRSPMPALVKLGAPPDRWLSLSVYTQTLLEILEDRRFTGFPNLKYIMVKGDYRNSEPIDPTITSRVTLPQALLYRVHLGKATQHLHQLRYLPKAMITHLTLAVGHELHLSSLEVALRHTKHLKDLDLTILFSFEGQLPPPTAHFVPIPSLTHLSLDAPPRSISYVLLNFGFSAISSIRIQGRKAVDERPYPNPLEVLLGPLPTLSSLIIEGLWNWDHCSALIRASMPESLKLTDSFKARAIRNSVCRLVEDIVTDKGSASSITSLVLSSDSTDFALPLVEDVVETLQEVALYSEFSAVFLGGGSRSGDQAAKWVDIRCPFVRLAKGTLENLDTAQKGLAPRVRIRLLIHSRG